MLCGALLIAAMFTRPQLLYLPAILLAVLGVRALRQRRSISSILRLWPLIAGISGAYALVLVYMVAFWAAYGATPDSRQANKVATLMLVVAVHVAIGSLADFVDYPRLRMPVDWAMLAVTVLALAQLFSGAHDRKTPVVERSNGLVADAALQTPTLKTRRTPAAKVARTWK